MVRGEHLRLARANARLATTDARACICVRALQSLKVRLASKRKPAGWELIEEPLMQFEERLREAGWAKRPGALNENRVGVAQSPVRPLTLSHEQQSADASAARLRTPTQLGSAHAAATPTNELSVGERSALVTDLVRIAAGISSPISSSLPSPPR